MNFKIKVIFSNAENVKGGIHMEKEIIIAENELIRLYSIEEKKKFFEEKQYLSVENLIKINMNYAKITPNK